jgi:hypothetical protein
MIAGAGVAAAGCANTCSGVYGDNMAGRGGTYPYAVDYEMVLENVSLAGCSEANPTIHAYTYDPNLGTACNAKFIVYAADGAGGEPGTLLWTGSSFTINSETEAEFNAATTISCMSGSTYWIGLIVTLGGGASCAFNYTTDAGYKTRRATDADFTPPSTWPLDSDTHETRILPWWLSW